jgi:hypothetical protein
MKTRLKARVSLTFVAGFVFGALIWWGSPFVVGQREPWDAPLGYYGTALIVAGFITALISPRHFWLAPLGIYFGQSIYAVAFLPTGPLLPLGLMFGLGFCILALAGAAGAFGIWRVRQRS